MGLLVSCSICAAFPFCYGFVLLRKLLGNTLVCTELCCNFSLVIILVTFVLSCFKLYRYLYYFFVCILVYRIGMIVL